MEKSEYYKNLLKNDDVEMIGQCGKNNLDGVKFSSQM